jgi:hypothetical protein
LENCTDSLLGCGSLCIRPYKAFIKKYDSPVEVDEKSFLKWERCRKGVGGRFPLGCLPLWGREEVTLIAFFKRMKSDRISTEPKNSFFPDIS